MTGTLIGRDGSEQGQLVYYVMWQPSAPGRHKKRPIMPSWPAPLTEAPVKAKPRVTSRFFF